MDLQRGTDGSTCAPGIGKTTRQEWPVDPATLPPDAVRVADETVIFQDIEIKPRNTRFTRQVYYSAREQRFFRGALPEGYDQGDFGADLRALISAADNLRREQ